MPLEIKRDTFLPYGRQSIDCSDIDAVTEVLKGDYLTTGPAVLAFEKALAERLDVDFAVCVNSGTAALHLSMIAMDIKAGDYVIVPAITFLATANAARLCGADVLFCDVDPDSGLMRAEELNKVLVTHKDKNIKAVVPVHLAGQTENLTAIRALADQHQLRVIEDACHALGTEYQGDCIGACQQSDATVFSFHPVKTIAMGEGGAITTTSEKLYRRLLLLRNHGMLRDRGAMQYMDRATSKKGLDNPWYYEMVELGLNYRESDIHCALGLSQLKKLNQFIKKRHDLVAYYDQLLAPLAPLIQPIKKTGCGEVAWHLYSVLIDFEQLNVERADLMQALREKKVGTQVLYIPVNEQPYYRDRYGDLSLPGANQYYARTLSLPLYPAMSRGDVAYVVRCLSDLMPGLLKTRRTNSELT